MEKMILLAELVGGRGEKKTEAYDNIEAKSLLKQSIDFPTVDQPTVKVITTQDKYK